jgi:hypothetical protein
MHACKVGNELPEQERARGEKRGIKWGDFGWKLKVNCREDKLGTGSDRKIPSYVCVCNGEKLAWTIFPGLRVHFGALAGGPTFCING